MFLHASIQLGLANVPMGVVRRRLADELPASDRSGDFFVVRHVDEVCATATADTADDLHEIVSALESAARSLADEHALRGMPVVDDEERAAVEQMAWLLPA